MKKVETPWNVMYKICTIFGIPFFLLGMFLLLSNGNWAFIFNGMLWIILGIIAKAKVAYYERKLQKLKQDGICYDGIIINICPSPLIRIGSYMTSRVECSYKAEKNDDTIKSNYFVLLPFDTQKNLCAKIYFNNRNLKDFAVELYRIENLKIG